MLHDGPTPDDIHRPLDQWIVKGHDALLAE